jgi:hypothetical protein
MGPADQIRVNRVLDDWWNLNSFNVKPAAPFLVKVEAGSSFGTARGADVLHEGAADKLSRMTPLSFVFGDCVRVCYPEQARIREQAFV